MTEAATGKEIVYESVRACARAFGVDGSVIKRYANNPDTSYAGYYFKII